MIFFFADRRHSAPLFSLHCCVFALFLFILCLVSNVGRFSGLIALSVFFNLRFIIPQYACVVQKSIYNY